MAENSSNNADANSKRERLIKPTATPLQQGLEGEPPALDENPALSPNTQKVLQSDTTQRKTLLDGNFSLAQRQALARQIGQIGGNRHLSRILRTATPAATPAPATPEAVAPTEELTTSPERTGLAFTPPTPPNGNGDDALASPSLPPTIQAKLLVGPVNDRYEQEAEQKANEVVNQPVSPPAPTVQRQPEDEELTETAQRAPAAAVAADGSFEADGDVESRLQTRKGGGNPLPDVLRKELEPQYGADFSGVRVHTDGASVALNQDLQAQAFTHGSDIFFGQDKYNPGTSDGKHLLAHELTHVVQQGGAGSLAQPKLRRKAGPVSIEEAAQAAITQVTPDEADKEVVEPAEAAPMELPGDNKVEGVAEVSAGSAPGGAAAEVPAAEAPATDAPVAEAPTAEAAVETFGVETPTAETAVEAPIAEAPAVEAPIAEASAVKDPTTDVSATNTPAAPDTALSSSKATGTETPAADATATSAPTEKSDAGAAAVVDAKVAASTSETATPLADVKPETPPAISAAENNATAIPTAATNEMTLAVAQDTPTATTAPVADSNTTASEEDAQPQVQRLALPAGHIQRKAPAPGGEQVGGVLAPRSPEADPAFQQVVQGVGQQGKVESTHAPAQQKAEEAAGAAVMPPTEKMGAAQNMQAASIEQEATAQANQAQGDKAPGFNEDQFVNDVYKLIDGLMPDDPRKMENIESSGVFDKVDDTVKGKVKEGKEAAQGQVDDKAEQTPPTNAVPDKPVDPLQQNDPGSAPNDLNATGAAPKNKGVGEVEAPLQAESQKLDTQMAEKKVTAEQLRNSNEPSFVAAMDAKDTAQKAALEDPQQYRTTEQQTIDSAKAEANVQAKDGLGAMHADRTGVFAQMDGVQTTGKTSDEAARDQIGQAIDQIYNNTKTSVETELTAMDEEVSSTFQAESGTVKNDVIAQIKAETKAYKDERYAKEKEWSLQNAGAKVVGGLTEAWDNFTNMPPEYFEIYKRGREEYTRRIREVIRKVAGIVKTHLDTVKKAIADGRKSIQAEVDKQPAHLREVAQETADNALGKFDELESSVEDRVQNLKENLAQSYVDNLTALDSELDKMKEEDKGLLAKAGDMMGEVFQTIENLRQMLMSTLASAQAAVEKILQNPMAFMGNLMEALKQGFAQFVGNIGTHLQAGLINWLTGTMSSTGITLPKSLDDLPGIFNMVLQLLGLTYPQIRGRVVKALGPHGETIVSALETTWQIFQMIKDGNLAALWEFIQGMIGDLKNMVIEQIKQMVVEQVITIGLDKLTSLLAGPFGAFIEAAKAIVKAVMWLIDNGPRIMAVVNGIISSASAIADGNIGGAASFIEGVLAKSVPMVISFLADLLSLGGLAKKVQKLIQTIQKPFNEAIDWVVKQAKAIGKKLLGKLGFGKKKGQTSDNERSDGQVGDGEVGETINFSTEKESHRLWLNVQGSSVTVMMASQAVPVDTKLNQWAEKSAKNRGKGGGLLKQARELWNKTQQQGKEVVQDKQEGEAGNEQAVSKFESGDTALEKEQQELALILKQLVEMFDEDSIHKYIGKPVDSIEKAPEGYDFYSMPLREIRRAAHAADNPLYPQVHVDEQGLIQEGYGPLRSDYALIQEYNKATVRIRDVNGDEAPKALAGNPQSLANSLRSAKIAQFATGVRAQMRGIINAINGGQTVTGVEVSLGGKHRVDYTLSDQGENVAVEYKHWTGTLTNEGREDLVDRLYRQLSNYVQLCPAKGYKRLVLQWPEFYNLDEKSQKAFRQVIKSIMKEVKELNDPKTNSTSHFSFEAPDLEK